MSVVLQFRTIRNSTVAINDQWLLLKPELLWLLIVYSQLYIAAPHVRFMKTITTVLFINIFFVGGITVIRLSVITVWCEYLLEISLGNLEVKLLGKNVYLYSIYLYDTYKNLLDFAWLNRFLHFWILKCQISASRPLIHRFSQMY